ncbi:hypothetical protein AJ80_05224 [Polytolypa hystricis UAMH7299]|uniref:HAD hydrolase, family IA n=1 Tax=Polytolypa hystricis (strain UAMH7299) TaxID=1447883 RepID=A0A2B7XX71_POLH7|nr:hypothetical protein AJ80_05224 [Polytolypa hystricis UAMH7299]
MPSREFPPVRACIFDVDGLLINSEDIYTEIYNNVLRSCGSPLLTWGVKARKQARGNQATLRLMKWLQVPITLEEWNSKTASYSELFRKSELLPGVQDLLQNLSQRSTMRMAVASSSKKALFSVKTSHIPCIDAVFAPQYRVFGDDPDMSDARKKPEPDIFLLALKRINASLAPGEKEILPEECLVFEDAIAGVEAARKAGMRVVWVPHEGLLGVCQGWIEDVLNGRTEKEGEEVEPLAPRVVSDAGDGRHGKDCAKLLPWVSEDGWAECIADLSRLDYERYAMQLEPKN